MAKEELVMNQPQIDPDHMSYSSLNSMLNIVDENGDINFQADKEATRQYFLQHVNMNTVFFHTLKEKLDYLVEEDYYEEEVLDQYSFDFIKSLFQQAYEYKFRFKSFLGALKYYTQYTLKTFDGKRYLERFEDRVVMNALYLAEGDEKLAEHIVDEIMNNRFQPATPTFLNAGKKQRGEMVSCFPAGTMVKTENGPKPIENITTKDRVLSHDGEYHRVEKLSSRQNKESSIKIYLDYEYFVRATKEHPFLVRTTRDVEPVLSGDGDGNGLIWVAAENVRAGDNVVTIADDGSQEEMEVMSVSIVWTPEETVYNLHVEDTHTYVANDVVVHNCFLLRVEDNMESISRAVNASLQLSKRGGGVALNLSNLRERGAPIKKIEGQSSGVVPVMKILEDSFSYANQLGSRQGAGAVYLHAHHPDIYTFLDTKRENADEKVRIKSLSTGVVIPDITFELVRNNEEMYLFSPYDVQRVYGRAFTEVNITEEYRAMVDNPNIRKKRINPRELLKTIAELQFESGYPYILFEDNANKGNPIKGKITMSNLCSEILQVSEPSTYNDDLSYDHLGQDISCNLGSLNIVQAMDSPDFAQTIETSIRALTSVSTHSDISVVPSIQNGNNKSHAIGLGQMNLHGFLGKNYIHYDSPEAVDFTNMYFYAVLYQCLRASNKIARERGTSFDGFENSDYANGSFFDTYINKDWSQPETGTVRKLLAQSTIYIPTVEDWKKLRADVMEYGLYNRNLQAVPPTGSISYINNSTSSIHPIAGRIETRKEGKIGRVYYPAPHMNNDNMEYYKDSYEIGPDAILRVYAAATQHVDQGLSMTMFYDDSAKVGTLVKTYVKAHKMGIKTMYYARIRQDALTGTEVSGLASTFKRSTAGNVVSADKSESTELNGSHRDARLVSEDNSPVTGTGLGIATDASDGECESCML